MRKLRVFMVLALALGCLNNAVAASAACQSKQGAGFIADSQISNNQVLVCASANLSSTTTTKPTLAKSVAAKTAAKPPVTAAKPPAPTAKPVCPKSVSTTEQIVAAALLGCAIVGPSKPPAAPSQPVVRIVKPVLARVEQSLQDQTRVSADEVQILASTSRVALGESVWLTSSATIHERTALVLGRTAFVKFEPAGEVWLTSQGQQESRLVVMSFATAGTKRVTLTASYLASYRFSLQEPWQQIGLVYSSDTIEIEVIERVVVPEREQSPRLVFGTCVTHPSEYRC
jgi:hypothetical protein